MDPTLPRLPASAGAARRPRRSTAHRALVKGIHSHGGRALQAQLIRHPTMVHHTSSRALVAKGFRSGFYWPTAAENARNLVLKCDPCQRFPPKPPAPTTDLMMIPLAWPF